MNPVKTRLGRQWSSVVGRHGIASALVVAAGGLFAAAGSATAGVMLAGDRGPVEPGAAPPVYVEGEILVRFKPSVGARQQAETLDLLGSRATGAADSRGVIRVRLDQQQDVEAALVAYEVDPNVEHVQPNYIYRAMGAAIPNDTLFGHLWGLRNTGQEVNGVSGVPGNDIDALGAWALITDCRAVTVAVLDTGVNYTHEDLAANMWDGGAEWPNHGADFVEGTPTPKDPLPAGGAENHGTHVAATIGAVGGNDAGITGVCQQASLMAVRVLDDHGFGTTVSIAAGIDYAVEQGASIINMSLGGAGNDPVLANAISDAKDNDVLIVVAAGNDSTHYTSWPCRYSYTMAFGYDNVLCVAALDQDYELAPFSNYGSLTIPAVNLGAPGTHILSAWGGGAPEPVDLVAGEWNGLGGTGWAVQTSCIGGYDALVNPEKWCEDGHPGSADTYAVDADERIWREFPGGDLFSAGVLAASVDFHYSYNLTSEEDWFRVAVGTGSSDPFADPNHIQGEFTWQNSSKTFFDNYAATFPKDECEGSSCVLGFQLASGNDPRILDGAGVAVIQLQIMRQQDGSANYALNNGTSMATPHVAGVAALVRALSPDFTYVETRDALVEGGRPVPALSDYKTTSGRAVDARGAVTWVDPPRLPDLQVVE